MAGYSAESLERLLDYRVVNKETVEFDLAGLVHIYFGVIEFKLESIKLLVALFFAHFKNNPLLVRLL